MYLTDAQLKSEIERCEYCEEKPCKTACPCDCSPADFIMAAALGKPSDYKRAAGIILSSNPLGGICGDVCPDYHCMQACSRMGFDTPINIPAVQSTIIKKAYDLCQIPEFITPAKNGRKIGIIGTGPAAIGAAISLVQLGYEVELFEVDDRAGGQVNLIPEQRLNRNSLLGDLDFIAKTFSLTIYFKSKIIHPDQIDEKYDAVIVASGLTEAVQLHIKGDELAIYGMDILKNPANYDFVGKRCAIVGGAIAADIALTAKSKGAAHVEMIVLESYLEMPLTQDEREGLLNAGIQFNNRSRICEVLHENGKIKGVKTKPVFLPPGKSFHPSHIQDEEGSTELYRPFDIVVFAVGNKSAIKVEKGKYYFCGDMANGPTTVVEAVATGKNTAIQLHADLSKSETIEILKNTKSHCQIRGWKQYPVPLDTDFFGRKIDSPFLLSAAPPTDGYEQMKKAYQSGWAGGIMKTAFDDLPIHIPGEYMFVFDDNTWANCDNVSDHPLKRVCAEIKQLILEFPDRLTMASTGGPVTGDDLSDKAGWQSNTLMLEDSGVMGIEYSLSCPQGGDGTHGDIVAQNAELTAKIVDWVMEISHPEIPKLFKLTGAVTAIYPIVDAIRKVFKRYPGKKAGITLANTFPTLAFREGDRLWEDGIIVGMSGAGVLPISYLSLVRAGKMGVYISGNGGAMNYLGAANMLALGAGSVQFCTIAEKYGLGIIDELKIGLSHYLEAKGIKSIAELIGCAQPDSIRDFMDLPPQTKVSAVVAELCQHCGNCTRCPYLAISLDADKIPVIDSELCVGCSLCVQKCFSGALYMKDKEEL